MVTARIRDGGEAAADQVKERIGREILACFGSTNGHGEPPLREHHIVQIRGYFRICVYERPVQLTQ